MCEEIISDLSCHSYHDIILPTGIFIEVKKKSVLLIKSWHQNLDIQFALLFSHKACKNMAFFIAY